MAALTTLAPMAGLYLMATPRPIGVDDEHIVYIPLIRPTSRPRLPTPEPVSVHDPKPRGTPLPWSAGGPGSLTRPAAPAATPVDDTGPAPRSAMDDPPPDASVSASPDDPASAPLRMDAQVIRHASAASKSAVRRMAESSAAYFGDAPTPRSRKLADGVAAAAKPDCLAPHGGGSLLSAFVIAYLATTDKCK